MQRSEEIREAVLRFYDRLSAKDVSAFDELVSQDPATVIIGTAPGELVRDRPRLRYGFETEGIKLGGGDPEAYEEGSLGWAIDQPTFEVGDASIEIRLTTIWRREDGTWRFVHGHFSVGVPDDEVVALQQRWSRQEGPGSSA